MLKAQSDRAENENSSDKLYSRDMKLNLQGQLCLEVLKVEEVLKKGKETGITLSAEEVQKRCKHLECCHGIMSCALGEDDW